MSGHRGPKHTSRRLYPPFAADPSIACGTGDPDRFFVDGIRGRGKNIAAEAAKRVCWPCPLRNDCLEWALNARVDGIWGATTDAERRAILRQRTRPSHAWAPDAEAAA